MHILLAAGMWYTPQDLPAGQISPMGFQTIMLEEHKIIEARLEENLKDHLVQLFLAKAHSR